MRKIIHIDMDAFYASVEQRDNPALRGLPVAVAGNSPRNVVSTASYEARRYGVRSALSVAKAKRLCPRLVLVPPRFEAYKKVSAQIHAIFRRYTSLIEPLSIDEAFLDVTDNPEGKTATQIAKEIKLAIKKELNLTASAGVSYNKFLAKTASDLQKPDGLSRILPKDAERFLEQLPIEAFYGVGPATAKRMHELGIALGSELKALSREDLEAHFGKTGEWLYDVVRGKDERPVMPNHERKSVGIEDTFPKDLVGMQACEEALEPLARDLCRRLERAEFVGCTLTLKIRFSDFSQITRSRTQAAPYGEYAQIEASARDLLRLHLPYNKAVRLLGITISHAQPVARNLTQSRQLELPLESPTSA